MESFNPVNPSLETMSDNFDKLVDNTMFLIALKEDKQDVSRFDNWSIELFGENLGEARLVMDAVYDFRKEVQTSQEDILEIN